MGWQSIDTARLALLVLHRGARRRRDRDYVVGQHQVTVCSAAIAFGLYIAFGELLRLALPGGREAAPIAMSAALSYAMVLTIARRPHHGMPHPLRCSWPRPCRSWSSRPSAW